MSLLQILSGLIFRFPRKNSGEFTLAPSEGDVYVELQYEPMEVVVRFQDTDGGGLPSCAELNDTIEHIRMLPRGFKFNYHLESGIRTIEWTARRYGWSLFRRNEC